MTVQIVTEENFARAFPRRARRLFWKQTEMIMEKVLEAPAYLVRQYQLVIEDAPISEQILAYHDEPLKLALELAGLVELTAEQRAMYESVRFKLIDNEERLLHRPYVRTTTPAASQPPYLAHLILRFAFPPHVYEEADAYLKARYEEIREERGKRSANAFIWREAVHSLLYAPLRLLYRPFVRILSRLMRLVSGG